MYACLRVTCHLHFRQNDRGFLRATAVTRGWNGHRIRVSTQSYLWRRKFSRRSCRDSNSQPFDHECGALPGSTGKIIEDNQKKVGFFCCFFLDMRCHFQRHKQSDIFIKKNYTTVIISKDINNRKYLKRIITTRLKTKIDYAAMNKQSSKP